LVYSTIFKDHLTYPRNVGDLQDATVVAEETNPICGDRLRLSLLMDGVRIKAAKYLAYGCPPTLVIGSVLTELLVGKTTTEALAITRAELVDLIGGLPSRKHHAASLALETLGTALRQTTKF
jgi:NifU-like protein involved in Fe-S cluster formation